MNCYKRCKETVIEDIIANLEKTNILTLYDIRKMLAEEPIPLKVYIDKHWSEYSEGFRKDLNHEVRKIWLGISPGCTDTMDCITPVEGCELIESVWDIQINGETPDIWVMEQGTVFNCTDIAEMIFNIYIGKVVWG